MPIDENELMELDEATNALVPVITLASALNVGDMVTVRGNRLYKIDETTNAMIPVVAGVGGGGMTSDPPQEFQYSTDEQWTGKYWINGKKIYTCVATGTVTAAADEVVNILLQSGVSALISVSGTWNTTNGNTAIIWGELKGIASSSYSAEYVSNLYLSGNEVWVSNHCELARTDAPYHYVLEYTKV